MYPKVRVRHGDADHVPDLGLKAFISLSLHPSPVSDNKVVSVVKAPKCYVPHLPAPRVLVTEESEDSSDSSSAPQKDSNEENQVNIRASSVPRPRAVISSPDNDIMFGNRNKIRYGRLSTSKTGAVLQNRHANCKVKSHDSNIPLDTIKHKDPGSNDKITFDTRKLKEPGSHDKTDPEGKKRVHKGCIKSENAPRSWKF